MKIIRAVVTCVGVAALSLGLSGCSPEDPVAARLTSTGIEFVTCDSLKNWNLVEVFMATQGSRPSDLELVWSASGETDIDPEGLVIDYGVAPTTMQTLVGPEDLAFEGHTIQIRFGNVSDTGELYGSVFAELDANKLDDVRWLRNGSYHDKPCA